MSEVSPQTNLNEKTFWLISCALVAGMLTCGAVTLISLVNRLFPDWQPSYLAGLVFFVSFERLYTYRRYQKLYLFSKAWALTYATEWVVILLLVKISVGLSHGLEAFLIEIPQWFGNFSKSFFGSDFLFALGLVIIAWFLSANFVELLEDMGLKQALILQKFPALQAEIQPARERLLNSVISLGTLLIILTALVRVDLRSAFAQTGPELVFIQLPALAGGGASTLLYFMLALALLSQTEFMDRYVRWRILNIPVSAEISQHWALYSLLFFAIIAAGAAFLPTSYSLGLLSILGVAIGFIAGMIYFLYQVFVTLLLLIISLPFLLLGHKSPIKDNTPIIPQIPKLPSEPLVSAAPVPWLELAKSFAFWGILIIILAYSILQFLRQHGEILQVLRRIPGFRLLSRSWLWLFEQFRRGRLTVVKIIEHGRERLRSPSSLQPSIPGSGFINLRRLDPRQKITFFYLALLRRAGENGLSRRVSQTPREYANELDSALPGVGAEIDSLTEAFVEARYSHHPIATHQADQVKTTWERIKKALRGNSNLVEKDKPLEK